MPNDMKMYEDMLSKLADEYPELEEETNALAGKMAEMDMGMEDMDEEEMSMPGDLEEIPDDLLDDEDEMMGL